MRAPSQALRSPPPWGALIAAIAVAGCANGHAAPAQRSSATASTPTPPQPAPAANDGGLPAPPGATTGCAALHCASIERCDEATSTCVPACPPGEVYIPATGPEGYRMGQGFTMGAKGREVGKGHLANSDRPHRVVLSHPFCMDETEVTVAVYKECVDAGTCAAPKIAEVRANYPRKSEHPVNEISWDKSKTYCEAHGKSLPTEAQWEWAATGGDGRKWPWGNDFPVSCEFADFTIGPLISPGGDSGCHGGGTSPVKAHPRGNKTWPAGVLYDMAGNTWEWCLDTYEPYAADDVTDPLVVNPRSQVRVLRGGGWNRSARGIQAAFRGAAIHTYEVGATGFRCVRNPAI